MKGLKTILVLGWIICWIAPATTWAQATAQISGTVRDASGAVLPGVQVTATQVDTGISRTTLTNETGFYVLLQCIRPFEWVFQQLARLGPLRRLASPAEFPELLKSSSG